MFNKRNKKKGFTLIELIIVIAIIAILAAIAVPAFGQVRQKANDSTNLGNARTIYSVVVAGVADGAIPVSTSGGAMSTLIGNGLDVEPKPQGKADDAVFTYNVDANGKVTILIGDEQIYPESTNGSN